MTNLAREIVSRIRQSVQASSVGRDGLIDELRKEFHGPPMELLEEVFAELAIERGLQVSTLDGRAVTIPVVLQVSELPPDAIAPAINGSGKCLAAHILAKRNSPDCPRFVALVPPGCRSAMSIKTAADDFGLSARSNSGNATIDDWWADEFIQGLVSAGLDRLRITDEAQRMQALLLIKEAVRASDEVERHSIERKRAWDVLTRVYEIQPGADASSLLCLACGFPPVAEGLLRADEQLRVLGDIAESLVTLGFRPAIDRLKEEASSQDQAALDGFLLHVQRSCSVPTAFEGATPFYYTPAQGPSLPNPPDWWAHLTVECWIELLADERQPEEALLIECTNSLLPARKGLPALVADKAELKVTSPEADLEIAVTITREIGPAASRVSWALNLPEQALAQDTSPPLHRSPIRYSTNAPNFRKAVTKVISLATWEPGVFAFCQTATRTTPAKKAKSNRESVAFESSFVLAGIGRHYVDLFVRSEVSLLGIVVVSDSADPTDRPLPVNYSQVSASSYGFEIEVAGDSSCDVLIDRGAGEELFRINISCDEATIVGCTSEFERLIRLNRVRPGSRVVSEVQINRQERCADLQTWLLDPQYVEQSYRPLVLAPDYVDYWRNPTWVDQSSTILSRGRFLNDPRPAFDRMVPPQEFLATRRALAGIVRGDDGGGLVEAAKLGEWLAVESEEAREGGFSELLERYLTAYQSWLEEEPDIAVWSDVAIVMSMERDGRTLLQEPDALILSPLHPVRLAWQAQAQKLLFQAYRAGNPCPAASILDAGRVPDVLMLPLATAAGTLRRQPFLSVECSSDYWTVLWNGNRLAVQADRASEAPFDKEFGIVVGGASSGFSVAQVRKALDDVACILGAKPVISAVVSSAAGRNSACDDGLMSWCRDQFNEEEARQEEDSQVLLGVRHVKIFDDRLEAARPDDTLLANLAEDTANSVRWFKGLPAGSRPDLGIIAQLESASPTMEVFEHASPVGFGGMIRHRVRRQLPGGSQAFLSESRMSMSGSPTGDAFADRLSSAIVRLENLGEQKLGYTFAPSVHSIQAMFREKGADFAAVSSSAIDPACFLGGWLEDAYLWDYNLPSYSQRAGDTNGYYLLSKIKDIDRDIMKKVLARLPGGGAVADEICASLMLEVSRRGIPTVRGLSSGDAGATGDLGLFISARLLQDEFRVSESDPGLLPVMSVEGESQVISMIIPVDPFRGYFDELQRAFGRPLGRRPDFLVGCIRINAGAVRCRLTPIEVKYRNGATMSATQRREALEQAKALANVLKEMHGRGAQTGLTIWHLAFDHLVSSVLAYGFRVYSQQRLASERARMWSDAHQSTMAALFSGDAAFEIDEIGRLIVVDASTTSGPRDMDEDGFPETIVVSPHDASQILYGQPESFYAAIRAALGTWRLVPLDDAASEAPGASAGSSSQDTLRVDEPPRPISEVMEPLPQEPLSIQPVTPAQEPADQALAGMDLLVGSTVDSFQEERRTLNVSDTRLNQLNIGVVGDLGTGKTQFLKSLILQIARGAPQNNGVKPRFLIFDYKKDYSSDDFVAAANVRVQAPSNLPLNLFDVSGASNDRNAWLRRYQFFSDVLDKIYSGIGPVQRQQLKRAVKSAYDQANAMGKQPTIYDVHSQYEVLLDGRVDSIFSILDDLVDMELFSRTPVDGSAFSSFLDGVVVVQLNELGQDDRTKNMLVAIMLNMFYEHMLTIPKRPYRGSDPQYRVVDSFLLVDEADNILEYEFDVLKKILLQGREFGVGVVLASQYLRHFKVGGTDYREPLLSWFIHKVPNVVPQELSALGLTADLASLAERVKGLPNHHCLYKTVGVPGEVIHGMPFYKLMSG